MAFWTIGSLSETPASFAAWSASFRSSSIETGAGAELSHRASSFSLARFCAAAAFLAPRSSASSAAPRPPRLRFFFWPGCRVLAGIFTAMCGDSALSADAAEAASIVRFESSSSALRIACIRSKSSRSLRTASTSGGSSRNHGVIRARSRPSDACVGTRSLAWCFAKRKGHVQGSSWFWLVVEGCIAAHERSCSRSFT